MSGHSIRTLTNTGGGLEIGIMRVKPSHPEGSTYPLAHHVAIVVLMIITHHDVFGIGGQRKSIAYD